MLRFVGNNGLRFRVKGPGLGGLGLRSTGQGFQVLDLSFIFNDFESSGNAYRVDCVLHRISDVKVEVLQFQLSRFDAREIENVVDEA